MLTMELIMLTMELTMELIMLTMELIMLTMELIMLTVALTRISAWFSHRHAHSLLEWLSTSNTLVVLANFWIVFEQ